MNKLHAYRFMLLVLRYLERLAGDDSSNRFLNKANRDLQGQLTAEMEQEADRQIPQASKAAASG